jgi:hypothetical protein
MSTAAISKESMSWRITPINTDNCTEKRSITRSNQDVRSATSVTKDEGDATDENCGKFSILNLRAAPTPPQRRKKSVPWGRDDKHRLKRRSSDLGLVTNRLAVKEFNGVINGVTGSNGVKQPIMSEAEAVLKGAKKLLEREMQAASELGRSRPRPKHVRNCSDQLHPLPNQTEPKESVNSIVESCQEYLKSCKNNKSSDDQQRVGNSSKGKSAKSYEGIWLHSSGPGSPMNINGISSGSGKSGNPIYSVIWRDGPASAGMKVQQSVEPVTPPFPVCDEVPVSQGVYNYYRGMKSEPIILIFLICKLISEFSLLD